HPDRHAGKPRPAGLQSLWTENRQRAKSRRPAHRHPAVCRSHLAIPGFGAGGHQSPLPQTDIVRTPSRSQHDAFNRESIAGASAHNSVYLSDRPLAFSTGYLAALAAILVSMAAATSMPVMLANSSA